jgi:hypothetical protein
MWVHPDEQVCIARLLTFLEHGERMAGECARRQADLTPDLKRRWFFKTQARQETMHAVVFHGAIAWLAPRHLGDSPVLPPLEAYRRLLSEALDHGNLFETVLAEQVILEGLGEAILTRIEQGLAKRDAPFGRLRRILLKQEEAHHGFGCRLLEGALSAGHVTMEGLRLRSQEYLALTDAMVLTLSDVFEAIDEDAAAWAADVRTFLPQWLTA